MNERISRCWNAIALLAVAVLAGMPAQYLPLPPNSAAGFVFSGVLAIIVPRFWFRMLIECFACKGGDHRAFWIALFFAVPIFSAFIYFRTTRSLMASAKSPAK